MVLRSPDEEAPWLFSDVEVCVLCVVWFAIWLGVLRVLALGRRCTKTIPGTTEESEDSTSPTASGEEKSSVRTAGGAALDFYMAKLRRMRCYCVIASSAGMVLFVECFFKQEPLPAMLASFGPLHQVLFAMAVAHWVVNMWEDWETRAFLGQGLSSDSGGGLALFPLNVCCGPSSIMLAMYFTHHTLSAFAYSYSLATHELGGVMVQGFLFELPVMFMLRREIALASLEPPEWLSCPAEVQLHWTLQYLTFALGRGPATCLWLVSILPGYGSETMSEMGLSIGGKVLYHTMALFFTALNLRIVGLYMCWHAQDLARARKWVSVAGGGADSTRAPGADADTWRGQRELAVEA